MMGYGMQSMGSQWHRVQLMAELFAEVVDRSTASLSGTHLALASMVFPLITINVHHYHRDALTSRRRAIASVLRTEVDGWGQALRAVVGNPAEGAT